jgi:hypothetical protein
MFTEEEPDTSAAVASFGIGGLAGAAALLSIPASVDRRRLSIAFAIVHGFMLMLAAINQWFWALPVLLALAGAAMTMSNTAANSNENSKLGSAV